MLKNKYSYLSKNMLLFTISSFGQKILSFLLVPLYTSYLNTAEYGVIDLVATTINILIPIFSLNMPEGIMRFTIEDNKGKKYLSNGIIISIKGTAFLLSLLFIASMVPSLCNYRRYFIWMFIGFIMNVLYSVCQNYLRATDGISIMVVASLLNTAVMLIADILFIVVIGMKFEGYYIALFLGLFVSIIYMQSRVHIFNEIHFRELYDKTICKSLLAYCVPTVFTGLAWWINSSLDKYFVTGFCGISDNGIYSVAYKIPTILGVFQTIFTQAWSISAIVEFDKNDKDGFFGNTYEMYNSCMVLVTSIIMLFNVLLSKILYSKNFFEAWHYVPSLLFATLFSALAGYMGGIFSAVKDTKTCAYSTFISAGVNIILNIILIKKLGIIGAAYATLVAYVVSWIIRVLASRRYIKMRVSWCKSILSYALLFMQLICANTVSHHYGIQVLIIVLIVLIYIGNYNKIVKAAIQYIYSIYKNKKKGRQRYL